MKTIEEIKSLAQDLPVPRLFDLETGAKNVKTLLDKLDEKGIKYEFDSNADGWIILFCGGCMDAMLSSFTLGDDYNLFEMYGIPGEEDPLHGLTADQVFEKVLEVESERPDEFGPIDINIRNFTLPIVHEWGAHYYEHCSMYFAHYRVDNTLALQIDSPKGPVTTLTVNLGTTVPEGCAYIDTNNNGSAVIDWLNAHNIARPTGINASSGWCTYPMVRFNPELLKGV